MIGRLWVVAVTLACVGAAFGGDKKAIVAATIPAPHMPAMPQVHAFLTFASDADIMALWGTAFVALGLLANYAERRRMRRARIDRLGWVPWVPIFLACLVIGGGLLAFSLPKVIAG